MSKTRIPLYEIQDFKALEQKEHYFYYSSFAAHLKEHHFIREPHKHNFYIILLIERGTGTHTIDFKEFDVNPGTVFFMTPGQVHSWNISDDSEGHIIFFTMEYYALEYPHRKLFNFPFFNALLHNPVLLLTEQDRQNLLPLWTMLQQEYLSDKPMKHIIISRYLDVLLIQLSRIFEPRLTGSTVPYKDQTLLQNLEQLIDDHFKEHQPVGFYANKLNLTEKQLNEVCKFNLGKTTKELIQYRTLLEAQRLLVHAELTSSQIAAELGYFDNTYFFRFFKKLTGLTPEQFRARNK